MIQINEENFLLLLIQFCFVYFRDRKRTAAIQLGRYYFYIHMCFKHHQCFYCNSCL